MKLILCLLIVTLAAVLILSYNNNREPFEDVMQNKASVPLFVTDEATPSTNSANDTAATIASPSTVVVQPNLPGVLAPTSDSKINSITNTDAAALDLQNKSKILKDIQQLVHNELILHRQTDPIQCNATKSNSASSKQGQEFQKDKPVAPSEDKPCPAYPNGTCPSIPDMTQYIRKDSIPCWGCTLDY